MNNLQITNQKMLRKLFWISWIAYFISYIGRLNYAASMIEIGQSEGYTTIQLGAVVTALFITYGIGQLISGIIGDYCSPRILVGMGLIGCSLCNALMFVSNSYWQLIIIWGLNGFALSLIWPPMVKLFSKHMSKDYLHKSCFNIQTSVALGTFATYVLCSSLLIVWNWRTIFIVTALFLMGAAGAWNKVIREIEIYADQNGEVEEVPDIREEKKEIEKINEKASFLKLSVKSGLMIILIAVLIMGFLKDGIMTWVPQYITDTFGANSYFSIFLTAFLPLVNLSGIYIIKYINSKNNGDDLKTTALFYGVSTVSLLLLVLVGRNSMYLSVFFFAVVTSCMLGINTILVSILPTYFIKYNRTSFVAGLTNCVTYLGSALCGYGLGALVEGFGWNVTSIVLVGICILGIVAAILARPLWQKFKQ